MSILKVLVASVIALGLVLGLALPTMAAPEWAKPWAGECETRIVKGKVLEVREADLEFDIQSGEEELTISVDENTKYFKLGVPGRIVSLARHLMQFRYQNQEELRVPDEQDVELRLQNRVQVRAPVRNQIRLQNQISQTETVPLLEPQQAKLKWLRPFGEEAEFGDIAVGDMVVVRAEENSELLAQRVLIVKPTTYASVSGIIIDISSSAIEITPDDGDPVSLFYNESTVFILNGFIAVEEEQYAYVIYDSGDMLAKRVTVFSP
jgi:hypothetical protein